MGKAAELVARLDSWSNALTGLGTLRDKLTYHKASLAPPLSDSELEALYTDDDICAKIIDKLPHDALRAGFALKLDADAAAQSATASTDVLEALKALDAGSKLREAWCWGRLYAAGAVYMGIDDGMDTSEPLDLTRVRSLKFLNVLRRTQLQIETYYDDVQAAKYGEPRSYRVYQIATSPLGGAGSASSGTRTDVVIHESRLILFRGPTTARYPAISGNYWGDSTLQRVYEAQKQCSSSWQSAAHLMTDASQGVLKLQNLIQMLTTGGEALLRKRIQMMDIARSVCRSILVDADKESFERVATSFQGIPDLLDRFMMRVAAAAEMPVTILFGRSPAGMNATGESDTRAWYDTVAAAQRDVLLPRLEQLVRVVMAASDGPTNGVVLEGWCIEFEALWQPTDKELAEAFKLNCDALVALVTAQIALPEEAALKLAHDGYFAELDVSAREAALAADLARLAEPPKPDLPADVPPMPPQSPDYPQAPPGQ